MDTSHEELRSKSVTPRYEIEEYQPPPANVPLQEPDVIASTKLKTVQENKQPVPPPRLKRKPTRDRIDLKAVRSTSQERLPSTELEHIQPLQRSDSGAKLKLFMPSTSSSLAATEEAVLAFPSPNTLDAITRELENSFAKVTPTASTPDAKVAARMSRISYSLGNSTNSMNAATAVGSAAVRPSPSNSAKSNSAPARVSAIDPSEGLDIFKATYGKYVVKPQDGDYNKAEGPSQAEMDRIRAELYDNNPLTRTQFASTGSNSLGNGPR